MGGDGCPAFSTTMGCSDETLSFTHVDGRTRDGLGSHGPDYGMGMDPSFNHSLGGTGKDCAMVKIEIEDALPPLMDGPDLDSEKHDKSNGSPRTIWVGR